LKIAFPALFPLITEMSASRQTKPVIGGFGACETISLA
jgi:hypothetical protein